MQVTTSHICLNLGRGDSPILVLFEEIAAIDCPTARILLKGGNQIDVSSKLIRSVSREWQIFLDRKLSS